MAAKALIESEDNLGRLLDFELNILPLLEAQSSNNSLSTSLNFLYFSLKKRKV